MKRQPPQPTPDLQALMRRLNIPESPPWVDALHRKRWFMSCREWIVFVLLVGFICLSGRLPALNRWCVFLLASGILIQNRVRIADLDDQIQQEARAYLEEVQRIVDNVHAQAAERQKEAG